MKKTVEHLHTFMAKRELDYAGPGGRDICEDIYTLSYLPWCNKVRLISVESAFIGDFEPSELFSELEAYFYYYLRKTPADCITIADWYHSERMRECANFLDKKRQEPAEQNPFKQ